MPPSVRRTKNTPEAKAKARDERLKRWMTPEQYAEHERKTKTITASEITQRNEEAYNGDLPIQTPKKRKNKGI